MSARSAALPPWPVFGPEEIAAATRVLASGHVNYWTGDEGRAFEVEYAAHLGVRRALAVTNGTVALELALRALGLGPGDEVVVPSRTFIATASAVVVVGARPVCADVDETTQAVTTATVDAVATERTRAVVAVHLGGWPADLPGLRAWTARRGAFLVEDCAQAHGASLSGQQVGTVGDAAAFSFCQDKILTTAGEGGLVVTDDDRLFEAMWALRDHGKSYDAVLRREHGPGFRWLHDSFGTNARMTEVQAAVGRVSLRRLPGWVAARRAHAARLNAALGGHHALRVPVPDAGVVPSYYRWYGFLRPELLAPGWSRDRVVAEVAAAGVPCFTGSCPEIYLERAFPPRWRPPQRLPVARRLGETGLALLVHPTLRPEDVDRAAAVVVDVLDRATVAA